MLPKARLGLSAFFFSALALALTPHAALACAVCFGQSSDANLAQAYTWALGILMGATFSILGILVYAVYRIEKRREESAQVGYFGRNGAKPLGELPAGLREGA